MEPTATPRTTDLSDAIARALDARGALIERLHAERTDCYRIFHGISEGRPGLTVDRYGDLILAQTFREPLGVQEIAAIERAVGGAIVWNHRGKDAPASFTRLQDARENAARNHVVHGDVAHEHVVREQVISEQVVPERLDHERSELEQAVHEHVVHEHHVAYSIRARHRGNDPWLFLDLRAGRRALVAECAEKSVLNLFAYTGTAAIAALVHGAREAWNVDFARSSLDVARRNAELNSVPHERLVEIQEDVFPIVWQLSGSPVKGRASSRPYVRVAPRRFDIVFLDPPASSKGPFAAVDVERDYPSLFKPALLALEENGTLIATNHVAAVGAEAWRETLLRCAVKAGRRLREIELISPDDDFPAFDGRKPQKIAICRL